MPPSLDIYILSRHRDLETINRFIDDFIDRDASYDRGDEELMFVDNADQLRLDQWEWEPSLTLSNIVQRGLTFPGRAFFVSLKCKVPEFVDGTLAFTTDNQLVLGLSIDDEGAQPENLSRAKVLLQELAQKYTGNLGAVVGEQPPPLNEGEFRKLVKHNDAVGEPRKLLNSTSNSRFIKREVLRFVVVRQQHP